jgi:hypothetical protein
MHTTSHTTAQSLGALLKSVRDIMRKRGAFQAEVSALKRLQAETAADPPSFHSGATRLAATQER